MRISEKIRVLARALALAAVVVALDWMTKRYMLDLLFAPPHMIEVTSFFNLVLAFNTGISFSLFADMGARWILVGLSVLICLVLMVWLWRDPRPVGAFGLIIGGAVGNVYDRIVYGAVIDFLDIHVGGWHWPAFNLADSAITLGAGLFLLNVLRETPRSHYNKT